MAFNTGQVRERRMAPGSMAAYMERDLHNIVAADPTTTPDYSALAAWLEVLANGTRLAVLDTLREPKQTSGVRVSSPEGRPLSRQAIQAHINRLVEAGLVSVDEIEIRGRPRKQFQSDATRLFAASEALRHLGARLAPPPDEADQTLTTAATGSTRRASGPRLVMLHGMAEGAIFPLAKRRAGPEGWLLGRAPECQVHIPYDNTVSRIQGAITKDVAGRFWLRATAAAKNPVRVNWQPVTDEPVRLRVGDLVLAGNTKLVFRND